MRYFVGWRPVCCILAFLTLAGCGPSAPPAPAIDQIASVQLAIGAFQGGKRGACNATFTERPDITDALAWLNAVDWSQSGVDLTVARVQSPDGDVMFTAKDGTVLTVPFYWDGRVIDQKGNRLLSGADVAKLRQLEQRDCN